jgi:TonB family protein
MKKALTFALAFSCLALWLGRSSFAQDSITRPATSVTESGTREQDKLNGPVRRVRVETARIIPKDGKWVEEQREVLGISTYDPTGRKIDAVVYPVERSQPGRAQYVYDNKGNAVEMVLLGPDGSILSKESYRYEFDQLGNWTKMTSAVAVYENGKIIFEPTGVTYRTISYYYNQTIEKLNALSPQSNGVSAPITSTPLPNPPVARAEPSRPSAGQLSPTSQPLSEAANAHAKPERVTAPAASSLPESGTIPPENKVRTTADAVTTPAPAPNTAAPVTNSPAPNTAAPATNSPGPNTAAPATNVVQYVAEEELRNAAIELPKPEYSNAALQAQANGQVKVQILVDEQGNVTNAQAMSGHPLLVAGAEAAARKARFSLAKVSSHGSKVYSVITYDFETPRPTADASAVILPTIEKPSSSPAERTVEVRPVPQPSSAVESKPKAPVDYTAVAKTSYNKGLTFQAAGRHSDAADAFNETIKFNPNDANAYSRLGMSYSVMAKHKDALIVYKMARQINGSVLGADAYYLWGHSYLALGKNSEALSSFKQALYIMRAEAADPEKKEPRRFPPLEDLHYGMGIAQMNSRRFSEAIAELKRVVSLNPKHAQGHYALAMAYVSNGNRKEAEAHQRILKPLDPDLARKIATLLDLSGLLPDCRTLACR